MAQMGALLTTVAGLVILVYYALVWSISLLGLRQARRLFGRPADAGLNSVLPHSSPPPPSHLQPAAGPPSEGISILRPLAGLDHNLIANLSSSFEQDFPHHLFEVILSVRSEHDQALVVAREVCSRYPQIASRIIVGDEACSGVNPKIANLVQSYAVCRFDIVWVLDSQVQLAPLALHRAIEAMQAPAPPTPSPRFLRRRPHGNRVGLAHHVPLAVTPHSTSLGSHVEAVFLGTNHAKMYLAINALCLDSCVMGKSNFYRKSDLANVPDSFFNVSAEGTRGEQGAIGSVAFHGHDDSSGYMSSGAGRPLARFGIFLAEDNMLALSLWRPPLSLGHVLLPGDVARMSVGDVKSMGDYVKRRIRWIRVRRYMVPAATFIEPLTESVVCGILATWAFTHVWLPRILVSPSPLLAGPAFFLVHLVAWHCVDFAVLNTLQEAGEDRRRGSNSPTHVVDYGDTRQVAKFRLAWLCRELMAFPIWLTALCGNTVVWRSRKYRILSDARAARVDEGTENHSSAPESLSSAMDRFFHPRKRYERLSGQEH